MFKRSKKRKADLYRPKGYELFKMPSYSAYGGGDDLNVRYFQGL